MSSGKKISLPYQGYYTQQLEASGTRGTVLFFKLLNSWPNSTQVQSIHDQLILAEIEYEAILGFCVDQ